MHTTDIGKLLSTNILPLTLTLVMVGIGMSLTAKDFRNVLLYPKSVMMGLGMQLLVLPAIAFGIAALAPLSPELKVGIVLISAAPGGAIANLLNHLFKANLALSVSITALNGFFTVFTIPAIMSLALSVFMNHDREIHLEFLPTFIEILQITVMPCIVGMSIRRFFPPFALKAERPLNYLMPIGLGIVMAATIYFKQSDVVNVPLSEYLWVMPYALLLNVSGILTGYYLPALWGIKLRNRLTIAIEVGLQNTGLAIAIATSAHLLNNAVMAIPSAIYALFTFFTAVAWGLLVVRKHKGAMAEEERLAKVQTQEMVNQD
jgi:BASS family bile acid:Na+ symporter